MKSKLKQGDSLLTNKSPKVIDSKRQDKNLDLINKYLLDTTGSSVLSKNIQLIFGYLFSLCKLKNPEFLTLTLQIIDKIERDGLLPKILKFYDKNNNNILHILALFNQNEILDYLLGKIDKDELSSDIDKLNSSKFSPLFLAIKNFNHEIIKKLGKFGCNLNASNAGLSPLQAVIILNDVEGFKTLIALGANPNGIDGSQENCLNLILSSSKYLIFFDLLIKFHLDKECHIDDINYTQRDGICALHYFIKNHDSTTRIDDLIKLGIDLNYQNPHDKFYSALHLLCYYNKIDMTKTLILNGADVNLKSTQNNSILHVAIICNHFEIAIELLKNGADKFSTNNDGFSAIDLCKCFLEKYFGSIIDQSLMPDEDLSNPANQSCRDSKFLSNFKINYRQASYFKIDYYLDQYLLHHCDSVSRLEMVLDYFKIDNKTIDIFDSLKMSPIDDLMESSSESDSYEISQKSQIKSQFQIKKLSSKISSSSKIASIEL